MHDVVASRPTTSRGKYIGPPCETMMARMAGGDGYGRMVVVPTFAFNTALRAAAIGLPWAQIVVGGGMNRSWLPCKRVREDRAHSKAKACRPLPANWFSRGARIRHPARRRAKESDASVALLRGRRTTSSPCVRANWFPAMHGASCKLAS